MDFLFNPENKFWSFINKLMDVCCLGILWFIASIPIITMGAATTSLYQFTLKQTDNEEGYVWRSFWKAFRKNFLPATALWLIILAAGAFLAADVWACLNVNMPGAVRMVCFGVLLCLALIYILTSMYVFPILSRFDRKVKTIISHSFIMAVGNLYVSVTVLVIYAGFAFLTYQILILFPVFVALAAFVSSYFFRSVFSRYWDEDDKEDVWEVQSDDQIQSEEQIPQ